MSRTQGGSIDEKRVSIEQVNRQGILVSGDLRRGKAEQEPPTAVLHGSGDARLGIPRRSHGIFAEWDSCTRCFFAKLEAFRIVRNALLFRSSSCTVASDRRTMRNLSDTRGPRLT